MQILSLLKEQQRSILIGFYDKNYIGLLTPDGLFKFYLERPMGMAIFPDGLAIAFRHGIAFFRKIYHAEEQKWIYRQTAVKYMGFVDGHELVYADNTFVLANTLFNCLSSPSGNRDFEVFFKPNFVEEILPCDRHHINGIGLEKGTVRLFSCFSPLSTSSNKGWKDNPYTGVVWDILNDKSVLKDLSLPHSPRIVSNRIMVCESGKGRVLLGKNRDWQIINFGSFTRGAIALGNYLLVATSKVRYLDDPKKRNKQLDLNKLKENICALHLVDLNTHQICDRIVFDGDASEIFDIQLIEENAIIATANSEIFYYLHLL